MTGRDAAPVATEGAEEACMARLDALGYIGISTRAIFRDGWMDALTWWVAHHAPRAGDGADVFAEIGAWAAATFPTSTDASRVAHLRRELAELEAAPADPAEMAGVVLILAHHAHARGVDLAAAVRAEFAACQAREWGEPDADGVVEHARGAASRAARGGGEG